MAVVGRIGQELGLWQLYRFHAWHPARRGDGRSSILCAERAIPWTTVSYRLKIQENQFASLGESSVAL